MTAIPKEERDELARALNRFNSKADALLDGSLSNTGNQNVTNLRMEGAAKPLAWLSAGLAIGIALGVAIGCAAWVAASLANINETMRNNEAFIQATYQQAPEIRERFEELKKEQAQ